MGLRVFEALPDLRDQGYAELLHDTFTAGVPFIGRGMRVQLQDERGAPVAGAMVSALGATTAFALSDRSGRFELRTLSPGPYLVRAHLTGFVASRGQVIEVRASGRSWSSIALRHASSIADNLDYITTSIRTDIQQVNATVAAANCAAGRPRS